MNEWGSYPCCLFKAQANIAGTKLQMVIIFTPHLWIKIRQFLCNFLDIIYQIRGETAKNKLTVRYSLWNTM